MSKWQTENASNTIKFSNLLHKEGSTTVFLRQTIKTLVTGWVTEWQIRSSIVPNTDPLLGDISGAVFLTHKVLG